MHLPARPGKGMFSRLLSDNLKNSRASFMPSHRCIFTAILGKIKGNSIDPKFNYQENQMNHGSVIKGLIFSEQVRHSHKSCSILHFCVSEMDIFSSINHPKDKSLK